MLLFFVACQLQASTILKIAYDSDVQFPYYMGQSTQVLKENPGAIVELLQLLETKIPNLKIEFVRYPWKRCLINLKTGLVDATFNSSFKEERLKLGRYPRINGELDVSRRLTTISYYFYKKKSASFSWDGKSIVNTSLVVGAPLGFSIVSDLEKMKLKVMETHTTLSNLKRLQHGMVSLVALQQVTGDYFLSEFPMFKDLVKVNPPIKTKPYFLMLSHQFYKAQPQLSEKIWDTVEELREKKLNELMKKYFN